MASSGALPTPIPEVPEDQKFDGGIRVTWKPIERKIKIALKSQGLIGYIDGTTEKPPLTTGGAPQPDPSPVYSPTPSRAEWNFRNDRTKGVIESYISDLPSYIPDADEKDAKDLFDALVQEFGQKDDMRKVLTMRRLRSHIFRENESVDSFFKTLRELRKEAVEMGNEVPDKVF
ncbi:hypothetical protein C8R42DRAFT_716251 [Lentinula raphanica]|nr:hypothetical protein C8R42DRAFT_716251 [Lentinula raphanica]